MSGVVEEWRPVPGYEGYYEVSNLGGARGLDRVVAHRGRAPTRRPGITLRRALSNSGYWQVWLSRDGVRRPMYLHRLVAMAFIPPVAGCEQVNHKDFDRKNSAASNLEWVSNKGNARHAHLADRQSKKIGHAEATVIRESVGDQGVVADQFGVSRSLVSLIRNGKAWKPREEDEHVNE